MKSAIFYTLVAIACASAVPYAMAQARFKAPAPKYTEALVSDVSPALRDLALKARDPVVGDPDAVFVPPRRDLDRGERAEDFSFSGDAAAFAPSKTSLGGVLIAPNANFEGLSNQDNFSLYGGRVNPPDVVGAVGPNHYVQMINLAYAVYDKQGNRLVGPAKIGDLWAGFAIEDCTDASGDPVVLYDRFADRWLLSQFTTRGAPKYYNCVAISQTNDPTGAYYRYAFPTQEDTHIPGTYYFPDYPKYSVWKDSYILTTRDFGDGGGYGISVYALEKNKMVNGQSKARAVQFFLDSDVVPIYLMGDGLLPADVDGKTKPRNDAPMPIIGTMDNNFAPYGAQSDALNIFELDVLWNINPSASFKLAAQLPVASFDSVFPCPGGGRRCLPQPGATVTQYLDILSYRQRPTFRLAYRNFGTYESLVTSQSVEAAPGVAGMRWYEVRRTSGVYSVRQQGTHNPGDGVHRWMGSAAMDRDGNIALGYSVVNGVDVYPGIRYTGRLAGDPLGQMTLGEQTVINGTGIQRSTNNRWGDYTSLSIDPVDDCTFWYTNQYYSAAGQASSTAGWQTRIASFKVSSCQPTN
jgi:hypothetical protein